MKGDSYTPAIIMLMIICAVVGWGMIEFVLWIFSFVHISVG